MDPTDLIDAVIDREGGYVDHPADRGGATRWGITEAIARADGYGGDMRRFAARAPPRSTAALYWQRPRFDRIAERAPVLAAELFDTGVNMGPAVAIGFLQRALNALNRGARDYPDIAADGRDRPARRSPRSTASSRGARRGRRDGAAEGGRGAAGRTLPQPRRAPPGQRGLPLRLAREPHRLELARRSVNFVNLRQGARS